VKHEVFMLCTLPAGVKHVVCHHQGLVAMGLLVLLQSRTRQGTVEGSVTNSAADFLGSLQPPESKEFRLKTNWADALIHHPYDIDEVLNHRTKPYLIISVSSHVTCIIVRHYTRQSM